MLIRNTHFRSRSQGVCELVCWEEALVNNGLLLSGPTAVPLHKTLFKTEINFATSFTKLVAKRQDTSAR